MFVHQSHGRGSLQKETSEKEKITLHRYDSSAKDVCRGVHRKRYTRTRAFQLTKKANQWNLGETQIHQSSCHLIETVQTGDRFIEA